jgi:hypothetical protein
MKCITPDEGCAIFQDIHIGICGSHVGAWSLIGKTYMYGFFWPTTVSDADSLVFHSPETRAILSITDHTYYLVLFNMGTESSRSV